MKRKIKKTKNRTGICDRLIDSCELTGTIYKTEEGWLCKSCLIDVYYIKHS